jgi:hypothetical protein
MSGRTYEQKLKELQLDRLEDRRHLADIIMVHKIMFVMATVESRVVDPDPGSGSRGNKN